MSAANTNAPVATEAATAIPDNTNCLDRCSLNCGSCLFGIAVKIHYTFFILVILEVVLAQIRYTTLSYTLLVFFVYGPVLFFTVLIVRTTYDRDALREIRARWKRWTERWLWALRKCVQKYGIIILIMLYLLSLFSYFQHEFGHCLMNRFFGK